MILVFVQVDDLKASPLTRTAKDMKSKQFAPEGLKELKAEYSKLEKDSALQNLRHESVIPVRLSLAISQVNGVTHSSSIDIK